MVAGKGRFEMSSVPGSAWLRDGFGATDVSETVDTYAPGVALGANQKRATLMEQIGGPGPGNFPSVVVPPTNTRLVLSGFSIHVPIGLAAASTFALEVVAGGNALLGVADAAAGVFSRAGAPASVPAGAVPLTVAGAIPAGSQIVTSPGTGLGPVYRIASTAPVGGVWQAFVHYTVIGVADRLLC